LVGELYVRPVWVCGKRQSDPSAHPSLRGDLRIRQAASYQAEHVELRHLDVHQQDVTFHQCTGLVDSSMLEPAALAVGRWTRASLSGVRPRLVHCCDRDRRLRGELATEPVE